MTEQQKRAIAELYCLSPPQPAQTTQNDSHKGSPTQQNTQPQTVREQVQNILTEMAEQGILPPEYAQKAQQATSALSYKPYCQGLQQVAMRSFVSLPDYLKSQMPPSLLSKMGPRHSNKELISPPHQKTRQDFGIAPDFDSPTKQNQTEQETPSTPFQQMTTIMLKWQFIQQTAKQLSQPYKLWQ